MRNRRQIGVSAALSVAAIRSGPDRAPRGYIMDDVLIGPDARKDSQMTCFVAGTIGRS